MDFFVQAATWFYALFKAGGAVFISWTVVSVDADGKVVLDGALGAASRWAPSGETVRGADFSALTQAGAYRVRVGSLVSDPFTVAQDGYRALGDAALKAFYFNRSAIALTPEFAGAWARPAGYPDDKVLVHASAASKARPQGTVIASPKGWYDAGDYNKYVVNSGISTYTLLAALEKPQAFAGHSQLKTWLVGILKHKLIDQLRRHAREATVLTSDDGEDLDDLLFATDGHWREAPGTWVSPEASLGERQFFEVLEACMDHLPPTQGRVFLMREWLELSSDEICKELQLTPTNLYVQLHRARLRLRECLEIHWFGQRPATP